MCLPCEVIYPKLNFRRACLVHLTNQTTRIPRDFNPNPPSSPLLDRNFLAAEYTRYHNSICREHQRTTTGAATIGSLNSPSAEQRAQYRSVPEQDLDVFSENGASSDDDELVKAPCPAARRGRKKDSDGLKSPPPSSCRKLWENSRKIYPFSTNTPRAGLKDR